MLLFLLWNGAGMVRAETPGKPQRIVSLNLCVDQILLDLVSHDRIAALSFLASDPTMTARAEDAKGILTVQGSAEEVLALDPDLVLAGEYSTPATVSLLERLGRRVVKIPMASSFAEIRSVTALIAGAVGEGERGQQIIADFDERLEGARRISGGVHPQAITIQVNSLTSGAGSLLDEVVTAAGFENKARSFAAGGNLGPAGRVPLETLLLDPPDVVVLANSAADFRTVLGDNLRHPAFRALIASRPSVHLPMSLWLCGTPAIAQAVEKLAVERRALDRREASR